MPTYRLYRAPRLGTGTRADPFRSALTTYINAGSGPGLVKDGNTFWDIVHDARAVRYGIAYADPAVHAAIVADVTITALSPEGQTNEAVQTWLDGLLAASPTLSTTLEGDGIPMGWAGTNATRRQALRVLIRLHIVTQFVRRLKNTNALTFLGQPLDTLISAVPVAQRNAVQAWMTAQGLDSSWILGTHTVRQVCQFIVDTLHPPSDLRLGPIPI